MDEQTRIILDYVPMACTFRDQQNNILDCNLEALKIFGVSDKVYFIDHFHEFSPEFQPDGIASKEKIRKTISRCIETGYEKYEWQYLTAAGEPLPMESTLVRTRWKKRQYLIAYSRDLREVLSKENEARQAEARTKTMLDATPLACVFLDDKALAVDCNVETLRMFGVESKEMFLGHYYEWMPEYQPDGTHSLTEKRRRISSAFQSGYNCFEWMHQTAAGELLPAHVTLVRVEWNGIYCIATYIRDLRELKRNEQKAQEMQENMRVMLDQTPLICILRDVKETLNKLTRCA
jgi:PAS domain S-box-containing protein